ncbi:ATP-dependent helicase YprA (DUF1998 family) [Catenulispora sp. GAS73]|uniref:DEAD/DEAH box helicase n=1 Tax=Catenulispora sp. GAS73 TaxID=3156269 RepID=UPI0035154EC2
MDIFGVRERLIDDYRAFTSGSVVIRDQRINSAVQSDLDLGTQWPDPWLSLNPSFASGGTVSELVCEGILHPECERIFRIGKSASDPGQPLTFHRHQRDAIAAAASGGSYLLTTGTGSGKSLAYIVPIVDQVLRAREHDAGRKVRAIVVYPMNALANSQLNELSKFLRDGYGEGREPVTFARYTGQESQDDRKAILSQPPDILLTNYVMLELMLTRPEERRGLIRAAQGLSFLVFDELHTYRGRQGADVAMLIRRVRDACQSPDVQCVGTSATMSSEGTIADRKVVVADVASRLFGTPIPAERVIGETLVRATADPTAVTTDRIRRTPPTSFEDLVADPLAAWIESTFGLDTEPESRALIRKAPTTVARAAAQLAVASGAAPDECERAIRSTLHAGSEARDAAGRTLFAFRLHQFLSKGDNVYVTLQTPAERAITRTYQVTVPDGSNRVLIPVAFCRQCGQEYLVVWREEHHGDVVYRPRRTVDSPNNADDGYLYVADADDKPWPDDLAQILTDQWLPESWLTRDGDGQDDIVPSRRKYLPRTTWVDEFGTELNRGSGLRAAFLPSFQFCLRCGVSYESPRQRDYGKLASLNQEGRSSATTIISSSIVRTLKSMPLTELPRDARKLLTFVDNRQDASLQAGHFNDFVQVTQIRGALYQAMANAGGEGLRYEQVARDVASALGLQTEEYAANPGEMFGERDRTAKALRDVIEYRLFVDLQRGWRVTMPNLEQTGLLKVGYADLEQIAAYEPIWESAAPQLREAEPGNRAAVAAILLDELRKGLAIDVSCLTTDGFDSLVRSSRRLNDAWAIGDKEQVALVGTAFARSGRPGGSRADLLMSGRARFGKYLSRRTTFPAWPDRVAVDDAQQIISSLMRVLAEVGLLSVVVPPEHGGPGYRINAEKFIWQAADGQSGAPEPLTRTHGADAAPRVNPFFRDLYSGVARTLGGLHAAEHTAQVPAKVREEREARFRGNPDKGVTLPLLYCSPTMELGVDISSLNAVSMRNVPPTPANYAQRSGRAGRSGQPALVTAYCATGNSHDQYYFRRSERMVAGSVAAPRLDLANEDLVRSHVHAVWLAEVGEKLGSAMPDVLDISSNPGGGAPSLPLLPKISDAIGDVRYQDRAVVRATAFLAGVRKVLEETSWWEDAWIERAVSQAPIRFDAACDRWRDLYRAALAEREIQHRRVVDHALPVREQQSAKRRRQDAEAQLSLLKNDATDQVLSDFNPYRYFASEGFLPGYSFPRLPLAAFIPGSGRGGTLEGDYLQRSRFLAIREFGPKALIYHEGARYQVTRIQVPSEGGELTTTEAYRCEQCGYHQTPRPGLDLCEFCDTRLGAKTRNLLQLSTVFTTRRERISSDEEERRRAGFRLRTSFRFTAHGDRAGRIDAEAADSSGPLARMSYGDSATIRIANVGYSRTAEEESDGFHLNPLDGRWLSTKQADELARGGSDDDADGFVDESRGIKVIPFVEDRRNILVLKLHEALERPVALSLMYALERGIEAVFQLEDSELVTELLPPDAGPRDRILFQEASEGGAGVLRRFQGLHENDALRRAAREALRIAHYDPDTGADVGGPIDADGRVTAACERGCYDCLLSYGNQLVHDEIDRRSVRDLLLRFASATVTPAGPGTTRDEHADTLVSQAESSLESDFVAFLRAGGYRLPDTAQTSMPDLHTRPDYLYRLPSINAAVFVDGPHHDYESVSLRDADARERLEDAGWLVISVRYDDDWSQLVGKFPSVFGTPAR